MGLKKILYYKKPFVMKNLFVILFFLFSVTALWAQQPVVFHFNFSFEKEYTYLTNDLEYFKISIFDPDGKTIYKKNFEQPEFLRDEYGECLLVDTVYSIGKTARNYLVKINYQLTNKSSDSSFFNFGSQDTVNQIAFEVYFDQSRVKNIDYIWYGFEKIYYEEYELNESPKPVFIIKYLKNDEIFLMPTWFTPFRLNPRPKYYLLNNSSTAIYSFKQGMEFYFDGYLQRLDSDNKYKSYFFGFLCGGPIGGRQSLLPGETDDIVEGYAIGDHQKMIDGFYKFTVNYIQNEDSSKSAVTYFSVMYSK